MKTLGLLGGMTWESTLEYYRRLNERVKERGGGLRSARCLIYSFDFQELADLQNAGRWGELGDLLAERARLLEKGGAELLLICANTMHTVAERVRRGIDIPLVHIVEETAKAILGLGFGKVGLLGTRITMEDGFYSDCLESCGIRTLLPAAPDREEIQRIIFEELALGRLAPGSLSPVCGSRASWPRGGRRRWSWAARSCRSCSRAHPPRSPGWTPWTSTCGRPSSWRG